MAHQASTLRRCYVRVVVCGCMIRDVQSQLCQSQNKTQIAHLCGDLRRCFTTGVDHSCRIRHPQNARRGSTGPRPRRQLRRSGERSRAAQVRRRAGQSGTGNSRARSQRRLVLGLGHYLRGMLPASLLQTLHGCSTWRMPAVRQQPTPPTTLARYSALVAHARAGRRLQTTPNACQARASLTFHCNTAN
jgi:hypothetical protein